MIVTKINRFRSKVTLGCSLVAGKAGHKRRVERRGWLAPRQRLT